jgi:hypothetical protein
MVSGEMVSFGKMLEIGEGQAEWQQAEATILLQYGARLFSVVEMDANS